MSTRDDYELLQNALGCLRAHVVDCAVVSSDELLIMLIDAVLAEDENRSTVLLYAYNAVLNEENVGLRASPRKFHDALYKFLKCTYSKRCLMTREVLFELIEATNKLNCVMI